MATQCDGLTDEEMTQYGGIAYWLDGIGQASMQLTKLLSLVYKNSQDRDVVSYNPPCPSNHIPSREKTLL